MAGPPVRGAAGRASTVVLRFVFAPPPPPSLAPVRLPPPPPFVDPGPQPSRSLERLRRLGYTEKGLRRAWVHTQLAARLWHIANQEIARIRQRDARDPDWRGTASRGERLRRAAAHLKECIALLEGVLEVPGAPRLARLRLAYYLWHLRPDAARGHFAALVRSESDPARRLRFALDWAHLLIATGRRAEARRVLSGPAAAARGDRADLLRVFAWPAGSRAAEGAAGRLVRRCGALSAPVRRAFLAAVPRIVSGMDDPATQLRRLLAGGARCAPAGGRSRWLAAVVNALLIRGRPEAAWAVLQALGGASGEPWLAALRKRLGRRFDPRGGRAATPPSRSAWRAWLRARLPGWRRCGGGRFPVLRVVTLEAHPDGRVALREIAGATGTVPRCLTRLVSGYRGLRWRSGKPAGLVRLRVRMERAEPPGLRARGGASASGCPGCGNGPDSPGR